MAGTPVVVCPGFADQIANAMRAVTWLRVRTQGERGMSPKTNRLELQTSGKEWQKPIDLVQVGWQCLRDCSLNLSLPGNVWRGLADPTAGTTSWRGAIGNGHLS